MEHVVKGSPMCLGGRATAQDVCACERFAVGLFGGTGVRNEEESGHAATYGKLPPRTLVLLTNLPA